MMREQVSITYPTQLVRKEIKKMSKPYPENRSDIATPATDAVKAPFTRSSSLNNVNFNERDIKGFASSGGESTIETPATDGIKLRNVSNVIPKP